MTKKEIKAKVLSLLAAGTPKDAVFKQLSGQGVKDKLLAYYIAAYVDPKRSFLHERKVNVLVTIMLILGVMQLLSALLASMGGAGQSRWLSAMASFLVSLTFALGFYRHYVGAYNAYLLLTLTQVPIIVVNFMASPVVSAVTFSLNLALWSYVLYVRRQLFPDFYFLGPAKQNSSYRFVD